VNYAGVLLFLLGVVFFILEATVTSYGLLAIGGVVAMLLGSMMLIKTDVEFLQISWSVILPVVALTAAFSLIMVGMGVRAMRRRPATGREEMVGLVGIVQTALTPHGQLAVHGELWEAISDRPLQPGDKAEVIRVEGLRLHVKPLSKQTEA
jgi:membrane-bound serine protease (ClpP class)